MVMLEVVAKEAGMNLRKTNDTIYLDSDISQWVIPMATRRLLSPRG